MPVVDALERESEVLRHPTPRFGVIGQPRRERQRRHRVRVVRVVSFPALTRWGTIDGLDGERRDRTCLEDGECPVLERPLHVLGGGSAGGDREALPCDLRCLAARQRGAELAGGVEHSLVVADHPAFGCHVARHEGLSDTGHRLDDDLVGSRERVCRECHPGRGGLHEPLHDDGDARLFVTVVGAIQRDSIR